ncbi:MAG TPA: sugar transferase [Clostridiaceae bacterium]|nr:sugar transferase [Clostridiaceae bacterium]
MFKNWEKLPNFMKKEEIKPYYDILFNKKWTLFIKRLLDVIGSLSLLILLFPIMLIIGLIITIDSRGGIFYRQERVTQYGRIFKIFKFRTMVKDADKLGTQITVSDDTRITKAGKFLRKYRLDEIPQLINILTGDMSFVGTRPEVKKYVDAYSNEMLATLLLPAGVTSETSIKYKDEEQILTNAEDADKMYIEVILPEKMKYNLKSIEKTSILYDIKIIFSTLTRIVK